MEMVGMQSSASASLPSPICCYYARYEKGGPTEPELGLLDVHELGPLEFGGGEEEKGILGLHAWPSHAQLMHGEGEPIMCLHASIAMLDLHGLGIRGGARPPHELGLLLSSAMDRWEEGAWHYGFSAICKPELGGEGGLEFFGYLLSSASFCSLRS
ncbi:hypothetical protein Dimus_026426 [Dionaea muscipula]